VTASGQRILAVMAATFFILAGCTSASAPAAPASTAGTTAGAAAACPTGRQAEVHLAGLGGATETILEGLAPEFERETCMKLVFVPKGVSSEVLALIQGEAANPTIDAVDLDYNTALQGFPAGLFVPLDPSIVTSLDNLYPFAKVDGNVGDPLVAAVSSALMLLSIAMVFTIERVMGVRKLLVA
jgi:spermidine/putrescine-binding protein